MEDNKIPSAEDILNILIPRKENVSEDENLDSLRQNADVLRGWVGLYIKDVLNAAERRWRETNTWEPEHSYIISREIRTAYPLENIK
jgi:hypothetical protein